MENRPNNQHGGRKPPVMHGKGMEDNKHKPVGANTAHVGASKYVKSKRQIEFEKKNNKRSKAYNPNSKYARPTSNTKVHNTPMHGKKGSAAVKENPEVKEGTAIPAMPLVPPAIEHGKGKPVSVGVINNMDEIKTASNTADITKTKPKFKLSPITVVVIIMIYLVSVCLSVLRFKIPFLPSFMEVDFSIVPEFIAVVFFGPIAGTGVVVMKNITHMVFFYLEHGEFNYASELSNFVTDILFIVCAYILFVMYMRHFRRDRRKRGRRIKGVLFSGTGASAVTAFALVPFQYYVIFPMFIDFFAKHGVRLNIMQYYLEKMNTLDALWKGMLIFNLPWEFGKLLIVTLLATAVYYIVTLNE